MTQNLTNRIPSLRVTGWDQSLTGHDRFDSVDGTVSPSSGDVAAVIPHDATWMALRSEAMHQLHREPQLERMLQSQLLDRVRFENALVEILSGKLSNPWTGADFLAEAFHDALSSCPQLVAFARKDLEAIRDRDPVAGGLLRPFLFFKGFHALQAYRVTHWLWNRGRELLAVQLQNRVSEVFGVDIHPAARIGCGVMMDHATGIIIGETSVVEDNVSLLHEVTLGGTGKQTGDRHPKVRHGVLIGAGAKLLGNIEIGADSKVGAGSVVLDSVPPRCTVAGVPARIVGRASLQIPALEMDQSFPHCFQDGSGI